MPDPVEPHRGMFRFGNPANLAARLSDHARDGQILISRRTHAEVEHLVAARPAGSVCLKGIAQPVQAFVLEGLRAESILVPLPTYSKQSRTRRALGLQPRRQSGFQSLLEHSVGLRLMFGGSWLPSTSEPARLSGPKQPASRVS